MFIICQRHEACAQYVLRARFMFSCQRGKVQAFKLCIAQKILHPHAELTLIEPRYNGKQMGRALSSVVEDERKHCSTPRSYRSGIYLP